MISIILASRVKNNPDSNITQLIYSTINTMEENDCVEFLIKYDTDDDQRPSDEWFKTFPVPVKTFIWSKCEGKHSLHHFQEYLFSRIDPKSELIYNTADDFIHTRKGWISEALEVVREYKYCMVTAIGKTYVSRPSSEGESYECWSGPLPSFYDKRYDYKNMKEVDYLRSLRERYHMLHLTCPMWSRDFLLAAQNFGWQCASDSWMSLLESIYYDTYGQKLLKRIPVWYARTGRTTSGIETPTYNEMEVGSGHDILDPMLIKLLRAQARNLWLNISHDGAKI